MSSDRRDFLRANGLEIFAALLFGALLVATWRRFGDLLVDTPRELYHAWLMACGARPFLDFEHPHGAWALVWDGLVFRLFGSHSDVLFASNVALALTLTLAVYLIIRIAYGKISAAVTVIILEVAFIFGGFLEAPIFNYVAPYNQSSLHAMALATCGLASFAIYSRRPNRLLLFIAGFTNGAILFTRADVALALVLTSAFALAVLLRNTSTVRAGFRQMLTFAAGFFLPCAAFALYFSMVLPPEVFWRAMQGPWGVISTKTATTSRQLRHFGFDAPIENTARILLWFLAILAIAYLCETWIRLCVRSAPPRQMRKWLVILAIALPLAPVLAAWDFTANVLWFRLPWSLPLWTFLLWILELRALWRVNMQAGPTFVRTLWASFALLMLVRMPLNARVYQYGFYQALPATTLIFAWATHRWLDPLISLEKRTDLRAVLRGAFVSGIVMAFALTALLLLFTNIHDRTHLIRLPGLTLYVPGSPKKLTPTKILLAGLERIDTLTSAGATFAAVPEGTLYHYVLRRPNPTRFDHLATVEVSAFGEEQIVAAYEKAAPQYLALIHKFTPDVPIFGTTPAFGQRFVSWIRQNYDLVERIGAPPFTAVESHGVEIYVRKNAHPAPHALAK